jgi:hypothetical protein
MLKKNVIRFLSSVIIIVSIYIPKATADDELDKKIDRHDFGNFYPRTGINPNDLKSDDLKSSDFGTAELRPNLFSRPSSGLPCFVKGAIKIANWVDDIPEFRVFFEGQEALTDENGFFTFPINDNDLQKYRLIITRKIQHVVDKKNTFASLKVIPDKNYLGYSFKRLGHNQGIWLQKEKKLNHKNFVIPKNSIIILVDPKYVEKIEEWNVALSDNFIKLPRIVLKSKIELTKLKRISAKSLLCLEDSVFHERIGRKNSSPDIKDNKVKVTLP